MLTPPPNDYAARLTVQTDGPHDDATTIGTATVIAESVRFLIYASIRGGVTEPATVYTVSGELTSAAYRLPQLFGQLGEWLTAEASAGRITADHGRPTWQLVAELRVALAEATEHAVRLSATLAAFQSLTSTLHSANWGDEQ